MNGRTGLWISIALNAALAVGVLALVFHRTDTEPAPASSLVQNVTRPATVAPEPVSSAAQPIEQKRVVKRKASDGVAFDLGDGHQIEFPPQFVGLMKQLQEAGISERSLANFVAAEFNDQWWAWQQNIQRKVRRGEITPAEQQRLALQYENARSDSIKAILGDDAYTHWRQENIQRWAQNTGFTITPEQAGAVGQAYKEFGDGGERGRELSAAMQSGEIDQFDFRDEQAAMQKEFAEKMTALLGADGFAELKRSSDWQYGQTRRQLQDMNLPEKQFNELYDTLQQFSKKQQELALQGKADPAAKKDFAQQNAVLQQEQEKELQRVLGDKGYEQYQKYQDYRYQQMKQYAPAWQLSGAEIDHVYDAVQQAAKDLDEYRKEARNNPGGQKPDWNQINQATDDYKRNAEAELRRYLGEERFTKLQRAGLINFDQQSRGGIRIHGQTSIYIPNY